MRRTARALSVAALTGVALGAPASAASADPAAEVSPGTVAPGGSVTVSVTCDALDGSAPATLQATSQAFEEGTVELKRVSGTDEKAAGPVYRGSARVPRPRASRATPTRPEPSPTGRSTGPARRRAAARARSGARRSRWRARAAVPGASAVAVTPIRATPF
ncbi:hypothetical protein KJK32_37210 [Streptomyces sp. JCM17656]|nr:hypothetical protein KJK32_37210 [Streptomyces sp. JCM17656]